MTTLSISIEQLNQFLQQQPAVNAEMLSASDLMLKAKLIRNAGSFAGLSVQEIHELAKLVESVTIKAGTVIFSQGEVGDKCYLINSGEVNVLHKTEQDERVIATLTAPMIFGETSLLTDAPRNATLKAATDCELLAISKSQFESFYQRNVQVARAMMTLIIERSRPKRNNLVETFTQQTADGEMITILKNPQEGRYYRLSRVGLYIWNCLDGKTTLHEIVMGVFENFFIFSLAMVQNLVANLIAGDFAQLEKQVKFKISHKTDLPWWQKILITITKVMEVSYSFKNIDQFVSNLYRKLGHIFYTRMAQTILLLIFLLGIASFIYITPHITQNLKTNNIHSIIFFIILISFISIFLHELSHALTTKHFGYQVHRFGIGWYWITAIAFTDTSDMWLSTRGPRMMVNLAGMYNDSILGGLAFILAIIFIGIPMQPIFYGYLAYLAIYRFFVI